MDGQVDERLGFLAERRARTAERYDLLHSRNYDEHWGAVGDSHAAFVRRLIERVPAGGEVLDAACGTGKYWRMLLAAGLRVVGTDQSTGMLAQAARKHPDVPTVLLPLQEVAAATDLAGRFDAVLCVDALENVGPEHWPVVAAGLAGAVRPGAPAYLTVELHPDPLPPAEDPRQVPGELVGDGGYHFYPDRAQVRQWLAAAGFAVDADADGNDYWHLLLTRR